MQRPSKKHSYTSLLPHYPTEPNFRIHRYYGNAGSTLLDRVFPSSHACRRVPGESIREAMLRHEHYLALHLRLQPSHRVLDLGCGTGGPARAISRLAGVDVHGIDVCSARIQRAEPLTRQARLDHRVRFAAGDFSSALSTWPAASFDRAYSIEATCYAPDLVAVYAEACRVLKPGGVFAVYEVALTDAFDPNDAAHQAVRYSMQKVAGNPHLRTATTVQAAMQTAGFELLTVEDLAECPDSLPWYQLLDGSFGWRGGVLETLLAGVMALFFWLFATGGIGCWALECAESVGLCGLGTQDRVTEVARVMEAYATAGEKKLVTPMLLVVGRKPEA